MTLRLHRATLRHRMALPEQSWHSQVSQGGVAGRSPGLDEAGVRGRGWARADLGLELTCRWSPWARVWWTAGGQQVGDWAGVGGWGRKKLPHPHVPLLWPPKLLEFLDVLDDPVLGYLPPTVITILHVHLFSCAVDYRYPGSGAWGPGAGARLS